MALKESIVCYQKGQKLGNDNGGPDEFVEIKFPKEGISTEFRIWMHTDEE